MRSKRITPARAAWAGLLILAGCARTLEPDSFCREVGYAIAGRTQECTGDLALAEARYLQFEQEFTCVEYEVPKDTDTGTRDSVFPYQDLYHCPLAIRSLACELVEQYGDDLAAWMTASPTCDLLAQPKGE